MSCSVTTTVSTAVLLAVFSAIVKVWSSMTGASFTLFRLTVIVPDPVILPSVASTVTASVVLVS